MKQTFFEILIVLIIFFIIIPVLKWNFEHPKQTEFNQYDNCVVLEKQNTKIFGYEFILSNQKDLIFRIRTYEAYYKKYNVGDTIK